MGDDEKTPVAETYNDEGNEVKWYIDKNGRLYGEDENGNRYE